VPWLIIDDLGTRQLPCAACREAIERGLIRGRKAWATWWDLVSEYGYRVLYRETHICHLASSYPFSLQLK
jgi:hypothetical protein